MLLPWQPVRVVLDKHVLQRTSPASCGLQALLRSLCDFGDTVLHCTECAASRRWICIRIKFVLFRKFGLSLAIHNDHGHSGFSCCPAVFCCLIYCSVSWRHCCIWVSCYTGIFYENVLYKFTQLRAYYLFIVWISHYWVLSARTS